MSRLRAQGGNVQELADYDTTLAIGTYQNQLRVLSLLELDADLTGFDGGFPGNLSFLFNCFINEYNLPT